MSHYKEILSILSIILALVAYLTYIKSIRDGKTKSHIFSWVIWSLTTLIVFFAQVSDGAGAGSWPIGFSGIFTIYVAFLTYKQKLKMVISKIDKIFFSAAIFSIFLWAATSNPVYSVLILTAIDLCGFFMLIKKAYFRPYEEKINFFAVHFVSKFLAILALENFTITTAAFPISIACSTFILVTVIMWRRKITA